MVFFDIGGVMYDDSVYARSWSKRSANRVPSFTDEEFEAEYAAARAAQSGSFRRRLTHGSWDADATWRRWRHRRRKHWAYPPEALYPDVVPCLEALRPLPARGDRQPAHLGSGGDGSRRARPRFFEVWGVSATTSGCRSPIPAVLRTCCTRRGVVAGRTVMVGDRLDYDVRPAKTAGMRAVWMLRGEAPDDPTPSSGRGRRGGAGARRGTRALWSRGRHA